MEKEGAAGATVLEEDRCYLAGALWRRRSRGLLGRRQQDRPTLGRAGVLGPCGNLTCSDEVVCR
ncbi:hypothetical protein E2562_010958 [Oryza meyeriana var. granulata]|uniref:Uncharacterized protein n=1 Tax=Oryza meyeriana var. granulata TaxID=110450 RepID=A0A6G1BTV7_9ORYZ|nr:hypothetical protein E2562_010958 [Oryza meyeriana var. granulata]